MIDPQLWRLIIGWQAAQDNNGDHDVVMRAAKAIDAYRQTLEDRRKPRGDAASTLPGPDKQPTP